MFEKLMLFFTNWKTSVPALLAMACAGDSLFFHMMPEDWASKATALCVFLVSIGLIAAKDADKSNAPNPLHASKIVPALLLVVTLGTLSGCAALETVTKVAGQVRDLAGKIYDGLGGGEAPPERSNEMKPPAPANP